MSLDDTPLRTQGAGWSERLVWPVSALLFFLACAATLRDEPAAQAPAMPASPHSVPSIDATQLVALTVAEVVSTEADQTSAVLLVDAAHDWVLPVFMPDDCAQRIRRRMGRTPDGADPRASDELLSQTLNQLHARLMRVELAPSERDEARLHATLTLTRDEAHRGFSTSLEEGLAAALETGSELVTSAETLRQHGIRREALPARVGGIHVQPRHLERL